MPDMERINAEDELRWGLLALSGLRDLVLEAGQAKRHGYELVTPLALGELFDMVESRIYKAAKQLGYTVQ